MAFLFFRAEYIKLIIENTAGKKRGDWDLERWRPKIYLLYSEFFSWAMEPFRHIIPVQFRASMLNVNREIRELLFLT